MGVLASTLRNTTILLGLVMMCWLGLYIQPERWDSIDSSSHNRLARSAGHYRPTPKDLSQFDLQILRNLGKEKLIKLFQPVLTKVQKAQLMEALKTLTDALDLAGITYFMYGGTLIGSWRHHDLVPWDDDIDIIVNISDWQALEALNFTSHTLNTQALNRYKFYNNKADDISGYFWKWPYIDICFFGDNGTHLFDMDPVYSKTFIYNKSMIMPLKQRPLGELMLKAPHNTESVLRKNYDVSECQTRNYDHTKQRSITTKNVTSVDCKLLHRIFPFVIRDHFPASDETEELFLDGKLLHSIKLPST